MDDGVPAVLTGDFKVVPTDADIYNAWLWRFDAVLQPASRQAWQRFLAQGWIDATRLLHPDERIYTFWVDVDAYRRNAGFRMDFLLLHPSLAGRLVATDVDHLHRGRLKPRDHEKDSRALQKAVLRWTRKNYVWLHQHTPRVAGACLVDGLSYDAERRRLVQTYPAEGLRREPHYLYLDLDPVPEDAVGPAAAA